jgi:protein O-mannosyl-transferase
VNSATVAPWRTVLLVLLLGLVTAAAYLPVIRCDFVNYDDSDYVVANPHIQRGLNGQDLRWAFFSSHAANWHPLTWISHTIDWQLFGKAAAGHHAINVLFHILNTMLVFVLFRRLTGEEMASLILAAFFGLHPLHVESVAWISERKDVLSGLFFLLSVSQYAGYARAEGGWTRKRAYGLSLLFFGLGLMSKPMLVTLPFVLLLLDYWPLRRLEIGVSSAHLKIVLNRLLEKAPFFALTLLSMVITFLVQQKGGAVSSSLSLGARMANAVVSYARYLGKTFWPERLSVLYPHPGHWPAWQVIAAALMVAAISLVVLVLVRRRPWLAMGWFWFLGMLVPVSGLVQVGIQSMADRYMYLPLIGVALMVIWEAREWTAARTAKHPQTYVLLGITGVALIGCGLLTRRQVFYWRSSEALFGHAVRVTKDNYLAHNNLGFYLSEKGKISEAIENYRLALAIEPNYEDARNNLGHALAGQKKFEEAIQHYEWGLRIRPKHTELHNNLGNALAEIGRLDEAIAHYRFVLEQKPDHADGHNNLGIALAMKGQLEQAIPHFEAAIRLKPNNASAHSNLGNAFAAQRRFEEAAREYQECLRLKPDEPQARNNLGNVLTEQGRLEEAIEQYRQALALNRENPEAHYNLGTALLRKGNVAAARSHYTEALKLKPDYEQARQQLLRIGIVE